MWDVRCQTVNLNLSNRNQNVFLKIDYFFLFFKIFLELFYYLFSIFPAVSSSSIYCVHCIVGE